MNKKIETALKHFNNKEYDEAINLFHSFLEQEENATIYNNLALCYQRKGNFEKAEEFFIKSITIDSEPIQPFINIVDLYYIQKEYLKAIDILRFGISKHKDNALLHHYLARILIDDLQYDIAIDELDKVLELEPSNYDAYYDLANAYFKLGNFDGAIDNYENVVEHITNNEILYFNLAQAYEANDEREKAFTNYLKASCVNEKFFLAYKPLGLLSLSFGRKEDALEYFEKYIEFDIPEEEKTSIEKTIKRLKDAG